MSEILVMNKTFEKTDFNEVVLAKGEYEDCIFRNCNLSNCDLSGFVFLNCSFESSNISLAKLNKTVWQDIFFKECKMLGLRFDTSNQFGISFTFDSCQLSHSSFYRCMIKKTQFRNSQLQETDFSEADLSAALFSNCDLTGAVFDQTVLEKTDFTGSYNYIIDPETNRVRGARFSMEGLPGLLTKYKIDIAR